MFARDRARFADARKRMNESRWGGSTGWHVLSR
jgi:hypothetical protein